MIGTLYIIRNVVNDYVYIGSTTRSLTERYKEHLKRVNCVRDKNYPLYVAMRELDIANFFIDKIVDVEANDITELHKIEGEYIKKYISVGSLLYNRYIPGRSRTEWYEVTKDCINERRKQRYHNNKESTRDDRNKYSNQWYHRNKDKVIERKLQPVQCECGAVITKSNIAKHKTRRAHTKWLSEQEI